MGSLTRLQLVTEAGLLAANDAIPEHLKKGLNRMLRVAYAAWQWPFLHRRAESIAWSAGTTSIDVGAGSNGVTLEIQRIFSPVAFRTSDYSTRGRAHVRQLVESATSLDDVLRDPSTSRGLPQQLFALPYPGTWGKYTLKPDVVPDRDLLLAFDYLCMPADIDTSTPGDSTVPLYPNDETMMHMLYAVQILNDEGADSMEYAEAMKSVSNKILADTDLFGSTTGVNDSLDLDPDVFR